MLNFLLFRFFSFFVGFFAEAFVQPQQYAFATASHGLPLPGAVALLCETLSLADQSAH